jgi:hypothetical protein
LDYLGWDSGTLQALEVRHDGNFPIDWYTDALQRMRLQETVTYGGLGSFSNVVGDGYIGLAGEPSFFSSAPGAFSRLHLAHSDAGFNTTDIGWRPWMQNGITFTGNGDQMYIGHKYTYNDPMNEHSGIAADYTDAVIQWSDNPGTWLGDRMRFIFTS